MRTYNEDGQMSLFAPDSEFGKMCPAPSPAVNRKARTSASSSKNLSELRTADYMCLDLRPGRGNLLGSFWEINALWLGEFTTLNTGPAPHSGAAASTLSQILEGSVPERYYLSSGEFCGGRRRGRKSCRRN